MIKKIKIQRFRSIKDLEVELAPINIIYGLTSSGKSSLLYALLVIRNFILNPDQEVDRLFDFKFIDLGNFADCIFNKDINEPMHISYVTENGEYGISIQVTALDDYHYYVTEHYIDLFLNSDIVSLKGTVNMPYKLDRNFKFVIKENDDEYIINWNGINVDVVSRKSDALEIAKKLNSIPNYATKIDIVPSIRRFTIPHYVSSKVGDTPIYDDEVASIIINNPDIQF